MNNSTGEQSAQQGALIQQQTRIFAPLPTRYTVRVRYNGMVLYNGMTASTLNERHFIMESASLSHFQILYNGMLIVFVSRSNSAVSNEGLACEREG